MLHLTGCIKVGISCVIGGGACDHKVLAQVADDDGLAYLQGHFCQGEEPLDDEPPPDAPEEGQPQTGPSPTPLLEELFIPVPGYSQGNLYRYGVEAAKRDLAHIIKISRKEHQSPRMQYKCTRNKKFRTL